MKPKKDKPASPGPKPDTLKIHSDMAGAVKTSFKKKKPIAGWPSEKKK